MRIRLIPVLSASGALLVASGLVLASMQGVGATATTAVPVRVSEPVSRSDDRPSVSPTPSPVTPSPTATVAPTAAPTTAAAAATAEPSKKPVAKKTATAKKTTVKKTTTKKSTAKKPAAKKTAKAKTQAPVTNVSPAKGQTCKASFYWQPQGTASGERFNPNAMTAAHKTLPLGTRIKVTNPANGKTVVVRINDRGPYIGGRCLDLSKASFAAIGNTKQGVMKVVWQKI